MRTTRTGHSKCLLPMVSIKQLRLSHPTNLSKSSSTGRKRTGQSGHSALESVKTVAQDIKVDGMSTPLLGVSTSKRSSASEKLSMESATTTNSGSGVIQTSAKNSSRKLKTKQVIPMVNLLLDHGNSQTSSSGLMIKSSKSLTLKPAGALLWHSAKKKMETRSSMALERMSWSTTMAQNL